MEKKAILLRDDDLNALSSAEDVEFCYGEILDEFPMMFASVPKIKVGGDNFKQLSPGFVRENLGKTISLKKDSPALAYLSERENASLAIHGLTHEKTERSFFEFEDEELVDLSRLDEAIGIIRETGFSTDVFVPPHDRIHPSWVEYLRKRGLKLCRGLGCKYRSLDINFLSANFATGLHAAKVTRQGFRQPMFPRTVGGVKHYFSIRFKSLEQIRPALDNWEADCGPLVVVTHIHHQNKESIRELRDLLDYCLQKGIVIQKGL